MTGDVERVVVVDPVSPRERQVLTYIALGCTRTETAAALRISVKTFDTHRRNVLRKLRLRNNADLTRYAVRCALIVLEDLAL